jgi:hypothetical protein
LSGRFGAAAAEIGQEYDFFLGAPRAFHIQNGGFSGLARRVERRDHCIVITPGKEAP